MAQKRSFEDMNTALGSEWERRISTKYGVPYWFSKVTGKSVWEDPTNSSQPKLPPTAAQAPASASTTTPDLMKLLEEEYAPVAVHDKTCPRVIDSGLDMKAMLHKLYTKPAAKATPAEGGEYSAVFTIDNDKVGMITRAIQEDEILKTRLKKFNKKLNKAEDLESFWEVWNRADGGLKRDILIADDKNEAKWALQQKYNYKMATTFMPDYAKAVYEHFGAKAVLDPCSGWGDRLLGAAGTTAPKIEKYVAFDPNRNLRLGYARILQTCGVSLKSVNKQSMHFNNGFEMHCLPFEHSQSMGLVSENSFDLVFTSPPFFDYEMYNDKTNPEYKDWIKEFYVPLMKIACFAVKQGGYVCIHIGDTSAGNIESFLKKDVSTFCDLVFLKQQIGLRGEKSDKIRPIWVFQKQNAFAAVLKQLNPPLRFFAAKHGDKTFDLIDDGQTIGGTKQRFLGRLLGRSVQSVTDAMSSASSSAAAGLGENMVAENTAEFTVTPDVQEFVYAGPDGGMAQVALAYVSLLLGKQATIFINSSKPVKETDLPPLTQLAIAFGAKIFYAPETCGRTLKQTQDDSVDYVAESAPLAVVGATATGGDRSHSGAKSQQQTPPRGNPRLLLPFGVKFFPGERNFDLCKATLMECMPPMMFERPPRRLWIVCGSGFVLDLLNSIWPETKFMIVQVGKKIWTEQMDRIKNKELFIAPEKFMDTALRQPPYVTIPWYDAKLWQFVEKHGENGDFIWNVAGLPSNLEGALEWARSYTAEQRQKQQQQQH